MLSITNYDGKIQQDKDISYSKVGGKGNPLFDLSNLKGSKSEINNSDAEENQEANYK